MRGAVRAGRRFAQAPTIQAYVSGPPYYGDPTTDDATLDAFIRSNGTNQHHPVGTAGMSAKGASYGVVDPDLKLKGVDGVRIVDSSIFVSFPVSPQFLVRSKDLSLPAIHTLCAYTGSNIYCRRKGC
jgi:choline dehydrogenase-like flavoprotein